MRCPLPSSLLASAALVLAACSSVSLPGQEFRPKVDDALWHHVENGDDGH